MALVLTQAGAVGLLNDLIDAGQYWVHLYVNDLTPDEATVLGDFVEATFPGYAPLQIKTWFAARWNVDRAEAFGDVVAWTCGTPPSAQLVYGMYATAGQLGDLRWCERSPFGAIPAAPAGRILQFTPRLTLRTDPAQT